MSSKRLVLLGESAVGKSSIVIQYVKQQFYEYQESTIGAAYLSKVVKRTDEKPIKFEIWDTAGQERYKALVPMYYRNAAAVIVVYDITSKDSFQKAKHWINELEDSSEPNMIIALAGNKLDLASKRKVSKEEGEKLKQDANLACFFETSAKTPSNIDELFSAIADAIVLEENDDNDDLDYQNPIITTTTTPQQPRKWKFCSLI